MENVISLIYNKQKNNPDIPQCRKKDIKNLDNSSLIDYVSSFIENVEEENGNGVRLECYFGYNKYQRRSFMEPLKLNLIVNPFEGKVKYFMKQGDFWVWRNNNYSFGNSLFIKSCWV